MAEFSLFRARRAVDENLAILRPHLACKGPGCWGCCRGVVETTSEEFERLLPLVGEESWSRVAAIPAGAEPKTTICPLLDPKTKLCTVHQERPLVCRAYTTIGDWKDCYPELVGERKTSTPSSPLVAAAPYITAHPRKRLLDELRRVHGELSGGKP